jgi:uncharacterized protein (DUF58 family)
MALDVDKDLFKQIRRLEIVSRHLVQNALTGNYLSTFKGSGLEFSEVREYEPGDEVRLIDWNVTARMGRPFIKLFQEEREMTALFLIDVSSSLAAGSKGYSKLELAAQACAALGFAAAQNGDRVGFLFFSDRVEGWLAPKRGRKAVLRGLRELLTLEPQGQGSDLSPAIKQLGWALRRKATIFLLSDLLLPLDTSGIRMLNQRHDLVTLRTHDRLDEELPAWVGLLAARDPETGKRVWLDTDSPWARKAWAKRRTAKIQESGNFLRRLQVDRLDLRTDQDLAKPLLNFFRARAARARH